MNRWIKTTAADGSSTTWLNQNLIASISDETPMGGGIVAVMKNGSIVRLPEIPPEPPKVPYILDGLVGWYDGIWNAGIDSHDSSATTWVNLANPGTRNITLTRASNGWLANALKTKVVKGGDTATIPAGTFTPALTLSDVNHVEMVYQVDTPQNSNGEVLIFVGGGNKRLAFSSVGGGYVEPIYILSTPDTRIGTQAVGTAGVDPNIAAIGMIHAVSVSMPSSTYGDGWAIYENGVSQPIFDRGGSVGFQSDGTGSIIGRTTTPNNPDNAEGKLLCIRFYDRILTADEVAKNAAADRRRFGFS